MFTSKLDTACCVNDTIWCFGGTKIMITRVFNQTFMAGQTNVKISCLRANSDFVEMSPSTSKK